MAKNGFFKSEYNDIKQVYSIWICMNQKKNTLEWYHLTKESRLEVKDWKGRTDFMNIVMIGLAKQLPEQSKEYKLHRLLGTLFSQELEAKEKIEILEKEYGIPMEEEKQRADELERQNARLMEVLAAHGLTV